MPHGAIALTPDTTAAARWRVRLLGTVEASDGAATLQHFPSRSVAALLARLALAPGQAHAREALVDLLWPGVELEVGRNRLRQALSTLRSLLEPRGQPGAAVVQADRLHVRVVPGALACDVGEFEAALAAGRHDEARALYRGELMPGHYGEWVLDERRRLADLAESIGAPAAPGAALPGFAPPAVAPAAAPFVDGGIAADTADPARALAETSAALPVLPSYLTRLFGIEPAAARLQALVHEHRLVTVIGPGGCGKTRLAIELAHALRGAPALGTAARGPRGADGARPAFARVGFAPLVGCTDEGAVRIAIGGALRLPAAAAASPAALAASLGTTPTLVVLDNFEHLIESAAALVGTLLAGAPLLHVIITSRRALGLDGEREFELPPLVGADPADALPPQHPALALFVDRARAVRADFALGERQRAEVSRLVRVLGGLPLAIELAASRVRSLSPAEMLAAIESGHAIDLLARRGPRAGFDPRHASMRATIEWSWALLEPPQALLLMGLTLWPAPFDADAAAAVAGEPEAGAAAGAGAAGSIALRLDELVAHSLLRALPGHAGAPTRWSLLEPVREVATEQLEAAFDADARTMLRRRARAWLLAWARALPRSTPLSALAPELASLRALLPGAAADGDARTALATLLALRPWWDSDGMPASQIRTIEALLAALPPRPAGEPADSAEAIADAALRADAHELLAYLHFGAGERELAREHAEAALREAGSEPGPRARALVRRTWFDLASLDVAADHESALDEALALAVAAGDLETEARGLFQLAQVVLQRSADLARADALMARAQALWEQLGDRAKAMARWRSRARLLHERQRWDEAIAVYTATEAFALQDGDWVGLFDALVLRGQAANGARRWAMAAEALGRCAALAAERHHAHVLAYAFWDLPRALLHLGAFEDGARLSGFAERWWRERLGPLSASYARRLRVQRRFAARLLGRARAAALERAGAQLTLAEAVAIAAAVRRVR